MAYIGRSVDIGNFEKQVLTPDSSTTTFTLSFGVGSANSLLVVYGGVIQEPNVAYAISGGGLQIVFSEAPATGTTLYIVYLGKQMLTPRAAGQETTKQTFSGDGTTTLFTLTDPPVVPAGIMVFVDGILQREGVGANYVSSGSTINFSTAPDSGAEIDVYTLVKEKVSIDTVADGSITAAKLAASHPTWNAAGEVVISSASTGNTLRVTNNGTGNSLVVEDSTNPDATPFIVDSNGIVLAGLETAIGGGRVQVNSGDSRYRFSSTATAGSYANLFRSRSATLGTNTILQSGDQIGGVNFLGADGTNYISGALISAEVDGTPGTNDMPTRLLFSTTADGGSTPSERMRIDSSGNVSITNGNLVLAAGKGIDFSASSNTAGMTGELLDDYEVGTWTPDIKNDAGTSYPFTYVSGKYVKVGRKVTVQAVLKRSTSAASGQFALLYGLPFSVDQVSGSYSTHLGTWASGASGDGLLRGSAGHLGMTAAGFIYFVEVVSSTSGLAWNPTASTAGDLICIQSTYLTT